MSWRVEYLGNILFESRIPAVNPNPDKRIRVKLNVLGVEKRPLENEIAGATKQFIRKAGQFIYGKQNFHKGAFGIVPDELDGFETSADIPCFDIREDCLAEWVFYFFKIGNKYLELEKIARGVGSKRIHPEQIAHIEIPLPSIKEQKLFIENFKLIESNNNVLSTELTHQLNLLKKLRQQLLQDAVQGMLVPQNPNDESAANLLKKIRAEKKQLIDKKQVKQGKIQEAVIQKELLFEIPENWVWCTLDEISKNITDGTHQTPSYTKSGRIFLSAQNIKPFKFMPEEHKFVSEETYQEIIKNRKSEYGDILVARVGAGIGEAAVIDKEIDFCFYVSLGLVQPFRDYLNVHYLTLVINSPYGVKYSKSNISSKGGSAGNFNLGRLRSFLIPLPPLSEQHRIVQKLDKIMQTCDALESSIKESLSLNEKLLQQVLREAMSGE